MTKFRDLSIGQAFDWIDDEHPTWNSYYERCVKTGSRSYTDLSGKTKMCVGSINAKVYHVEQLPAHS